MITAAVRPRLRTAPMHVVGARRLVDVAAAPAAGKTRLAVVEFGSSMTETDIRIRSALAAWPPVLLVDATALRAPFGGPSLVAALTSPDLVARIPGSTRVAPVRTAVFGIGSGVRVKPEVEKSVLSCRVADPGFDPVARVLANRGTYLAAVETIVGAYGADGEDWNATVRGPLVWLGLPDPAASIGTLPRARDDR